MTIGHFPLLNDDTKMERKKKSLLDISVPLRHKNTNTYDFFHLHINPTHFS